MAKAYTPGLTVSARTTYRARRMLPVHGNVRLAAGDTVQPDTVAAETFMEGDVFPMKIAAKLSANPKDLPKLMLKRVGDAVAEGEPIARSAGIFGMFRTDAKSTASGTVESVSDTSGMVIVRGPAQPVQVRAYVAGHVIEVLPNEGVVIETPASLVQGIFGVGGETHGPIAMASTSPDATLHASDITQNMRGAVVVGGARMTAEAVAAARKVGAAALVAGGIDDSDLRDILGHDLGVAVTGSEKLGITLMVTEGFGDIAMATRTFELLASHSGRVASVNGATQIRAGVMRPEIVVPLEGGAGTDAGHVVYEGGATAGVLEIGTAVRIVRDPYFGMLGTVAGLPEQPAVLGSGSKARVLDVKLGDGRTVTVPRANVELIGG